MKIEKGLYITAPEGGAVYVSSPCYTANDGRALIETVNHEAAAFGERGIIRSQVCCFDVFGQPGTWQDAMETFTPRGMGGDVDLAEAKRRIGDRVCMIGGFDQFHFFTGCTPEATRAEVRRCFEAAGAGGGFILSPSDHFFEADLTLLEAFADEARKCTYP